MRLLVYAFFYGLPGLYGYFGGGPLIPAIGAFVIAYFMVQGGWRSGSRGDATVIKSLMVGTIFSAIPCFAAYFLGRWLS